MDDREWIRAEIKKAYQSKGNKFVEGLKSENWHKAFDDIDNLGSMSDEGFEELLHQRTVNLSEFELAEFNKLKAKRKSEQKENEVLSYREKVLLDLQAMLKRK